MLVAVLGASGSTGRLVVQVLVGDGHQVVALTRSTAGGSTEAVRQVVGDARDPAALRALVEGTDAVISALGPRKGDRTLHREVAPLLLAAMTAAGVRRFVGISGAGMDVPGDRKSRRDRVISAVLQRVGGETVNDKAQEYAVWAASDLDWTLVRPPRLLDGPATGRIEHHAHRSPRSTKITRADLAGFVAGQVTGTDYVHQAPLVAAA